MWSVCILDNVVSVYSWQCGQCVFLTMWSVCILDNVVSVYSWQCGQCVFLTMWSVCILDNVVSVYTWQCGQCVFLTMWSVCSLWQCCGNLVMTQNVVVTWGVVLTLCADTRSCDMRYYVDMWWHKMLWWHDVVTRGVDVRWYVAADHGQVESGGFQHAVESWQQLWQLCRLPPPSVRWTKHRDRELSARRGEWTTKHDVVWELSDSISPDCDTP